MKINDVCKYNRELLGLTIEEFAMSININVKEYEDFENGIFLFDKEILKRIVSSLYIEKEDLIVDNNKDKDFFTSISLNVIEECEKGE